MNLQKTCLTLFAIGCAIANSSAFAATCNNTQGSIAVQPGVPAAISGNTCSHNSNYNGSTFCGGVAFSNTGTDVYQIQIGNAQSLSFTVTTAAFMPDIAMLAASCADNSTCTVESTNNTGTVTANVPNGTAGTFFIIVTDSTGAGAQCGAYNLTFASAPVKLQAFSVE